MTMPGVPDEKYWADLMAEAERAAGPCRPCPACGRESDVLGHDVEAQPGAVAYVLDCPECGVVEERLPLATR